MPAPRPISWPRIAVLMGLAAAALIWLLLIYAADRTGMNSLPDAAGSTVEYCGESGSPLSLAEARALPAAAWRQWSGAGFLPTANLRACWVRLTLRNPGDAEADGVLANNFFFVDRVDAWIGDGSAPRHLIAGDQVPVAQRAIWGRETAFPVRVPAHGLQIVDLRAEDLASPLMRWRWWPDGRAFHAMQFRSLLAEGMYLGGLLALLAYNTVLWLRLRRADFGYYALYLGSLAGLVFEARAHMAWFGGHLGSPGGQSLLALVVAAITFSLVQFTRVFLDLKTLAPRIDRIARGWAWLQTILGGTAVIVYQTHRWAWGYLPVVGCCVSQVLLFALALWAWRRGSRAARFLTISLSCLFAASIPTATLWLFGHAIEDGTMLALMVGSALEMLLLSLAVADRFQKASADHALNQSRLVEETEQRRAIEEAYADELAVEVRERTRELEAANADKDRMLAIIGHDLRSPWTALTQSAEQLGAGPEDSRAGREFIAEAATMGRQALLLIEDLVLWARLRAGLLPPPGRHQVGALVAPVVVLHRAFAERRGVTLTATVPADLIVATDLVLAQTMLRNLVSNALKFARTQVVVSARAEAGGVRLTVSDDGPGLPPAVAARLTPGSAVQPDLEGGLGLRLCAEIGRTLGTTFEAVPVAVGTAFSFILPSAVPAPGPSL